ncbi:MAG: TIGR00282 family metallophosphoesterase [Thermodesulfobacteriota bacterium]
MIKVLCLGDIFGRPGRRLVREMVPRLVDEYEVDLVVANVENASGGLGLTIQAAEELFRSGVEVQTSGNHIFRHKEIYSFLDHEERLIRPANYPPPSPGRGSVLVRTAAGVPVGVINVMGRTYMTPLDCPFRAADREVRVLKEAGARVILVDVHAEATSEKRAMGWHLAGRVGAVFGTHTHVQTADEGLLPGGTAYISDLGMTGPHRSIIGMKTEAVLERFLTGRPARFEVAARGLRLEGVVIGLDPTDGQAINIERFQVNREEN